MLIRLIRDRLRRNRGSATLTEKARAHYERGELDQAEAHFREAATRDPADVACWKNLAVTLLRQHKFKDAVPVLRELIELAPANGKARLDLGICLSRLKDNEGAMAQYRAAIAIEPTLVEAQAALINAYLDTCDWDSVERSRRDFLEFRASHAAEECLQLLNPFCALHLLPGAVANELAAARSARAERAVGAGAANRGTARAGARASGRIRIGYVSSDFYSHATAHLTRSLYETHDRRAFEILAYSFGPDDGSEYRRHIERTCDRFIDVRSETSEATAQRIRSDGVDLLIDMKGHTANARQEIFAYRAARVQVAFLGYPATSGARYIDYFITDRTASPPGAEAEFTEKLVFMPDSYQINDCRQPIAPEQPVRADFGLPPDGFVYCCFNALRKIDVAVFELWMTILREVPRSVLWLIHEDALAVANLRREARRRGVDPGRLIFTERLEKSAHLARHRLADLFLDTFICNAHTTASDALWAGVPLLTCPGATFAQRVGASLAHAAGLPELVARDRDEYRALAVRLAREPEYLHSLRARLQRDRLSCPLFDTQRYVRHLEAAYVKMLEIESSGEPPRSFAVERD